MLSPQLRIVGYTVGNDVSARDIEGVNPLYLPQAKTFDACCALGPAITLVEAMPTLDSVMIHLEIDRDGHSLLRDSTPLSRMARTFADLVDWLGRDNLFVDGVFLLTGTGIVPPDDFSLRPGDEVRITIDGIGTLSNSVVQGVPGRSAETSGRSPPADDRVGEAHSTGRSWGMGSGSYFGAAGLAVAGHQLVGRLRPSPGFMGDLGCSGICGTGDGIKGASGAAGPQRNFLPVASSPTWCRALARGRSSGHSSPRIPPQGRPQQAGPRIEDFTRSLLSNAY